VERAVKKVAGVSEVAVNLATEKARIVFEGTEVDWNTLAKAVSDAGYEALPDVKNPPPEKNSPQELYFQRFLLALTSAIPLLLLSMGPMLGLGFGPFSPSRSPFLYAFVEFLLVLPALVAGRDFYFHGLKTLVKGSPNMDSLVAVGTGAAFLTSVWALVRVGTGETALVDQLYFDTAAVILALILLGKFLEASAKGRSSEAIRKLLSLAPEKAWRVEGDQILEVDVDSVRVGDVLVVKPGEKIALDGVVVDGHSSVDEALLTGESLPVEKSTGSPVWAGTLNKHGAFKIRVEKLAGETALAGIVRLVEEAQGAKAPIARLADVVSSYFVPVVFVLAGLAFLAWFLTGHSAVFSLTISVAVLVIACPCALGLATPTAVMVASGKGAELGIFFKNGAALESLNQIDTVVFDKTGTLTEGKPRVAGVFTLPGFDPDELINACAAVESVSEHPLAEALAEHTRGKALPSVENFEAFPGLGVRAFVRGEEILVGNQAFLKVNETETEPLDATAQGWAQMGATPLYVARARQAAGLVRVEDLVKPSAFLAVKDLHGMGIKTVLLTGDRKETAEAVAKKLGIDKVIAQVLPQQKAQSVASLQASGSKVAFVGDGINDAPALVQADSGLALVGGTDVAVESADIVLMRSDLQSVPTALALGRRTIAVIKQNLFWAFGYNVLGIPVAAGVLTLFGGPTLNPVFAALAMSLSSVSVVSNALRLKGFHAVASPVVASPAINLVSERSFAMRKILTVEGMTCQHCVARVNKALAGVEGLAQVKVDLATGRAEVSVQNPRDELDVLMKAAVEDAGYTVAQIQTVPA
jgi:Cu+-exporting ATPase